MRRAWAVIAALAAALIATAPGVAATRPACAPALGEAGAPAALPSVYTEAQRVAVSAIIFEAMRAPSKGPRPETALDKRAPCPIATFQVREDRFSLNGGAAPGPLRWVTSANTALAFYLVPGREGPAAAELGFKRQPFALAAVVTLADDRMRHVLRLFDGPPSDEMIEQTIRESLTSGDFVPLADYDREGDAVTLFRGTLSHKSAQLFGPAPSGNRTAAILLPDGTYFLEGQARGAVMRDVGITCPAELGPLRDRQLVIVEADADQQDLACQYGSDDVRMSIFVERLPKADLARFFEEQRADMMKDYKDPKDTPQLVGVNGPTRFEHGASWLGAGDKAGGIWIGRKGDYVIELDGTWTVDSYRDARAAIKAFDQLTFGP